MVAALTILGALKQQQDADAAQAALAKSLGDLKQAVYALTKPLSAAPSQTAPARDPDGVYQNDRLVGTVIAPRITLNESRVYFAEIQNATDLDINKPFEYRDFVLRVIHVNARIGLLLSPGSVSTGVLENVVCEIIGGR
jgi:hypothetical protein